MCTVHARGKGESILKHKQSVSGRAQKKTTSKVTTNHLYVCEKELDSTKQIKGKYYAHTNTHKHTCLPYIVMIHGHSRSTRAVLYIANTITLTCGCSNAANKNKKHQVKRDENQKLGLDAVGTQRSPCKCSRVYVFVSAAALHLGPYKQIEKRSY